MTPDQKISTPALYAAAMEFGPTPEDRAALRRMLELRDHAIDLLGAGDSHHRAADAVLDRVPCDAWCAYAMDIDDGALDQYLRTVVRELRRGVPALWASQWAAGLLNP